MSPPFSPFPLKARSQQHLMRPNTMRSNLPSNQPSEIARDCPRSLPGSAWHFRTSLWRRSSARDLHAVGPAQPASSLPSLPA